MIQPNRYSKSTELRGMPILMPLYMHRYEYAKPTTFFEVTSYWRLTANLDRSRIPQVKAVIKRESHFHSVIALTTSEPFHRPTNKHSQRHFPRRTADSPNFRISTSREHKNNKEQSGSKWRRPCFTPLLPQKAFSSSRFNISSELPLYDQSTGAQLLQVILRMAT